MMGIMGVEMGSWIQILDIFGVKANWMCRVKKREIKDDA
jgi:hypothetical protein